ncbi:MAG: hypothetical protein GXC72_01310 [Chitinophagaceae bacterium]|nr:hypothetical protein [Chitinophagaceae bacterium]
MTKKAFHFPALFLFFSFLYLANPIQAQRAGVSVKLNMGTSFSKSGDDLAKVTVNGNSRTFITTELGYAFNYNKKTGFGMKIAAVGSYEKAHVLASNRLSQLKITIPGIRARIYPLHYDGKIFDGLEKIMPKKVPFLLDLPVIVAGYAVLNSFHLDYGVGFGSILETEYAYSGFADQTTKRTMRYFGWGFHPPMFQAASGKWSGNAVLDFGKYSWTNGAGGTSSVKVNTLGFGIQYHF